MALTGGGTPPGSLAPAPTAARLAAAGAPEVRKTGREVPWTQLWAPSAQRGGKQRQGECRCGGRPCSGKSGWEGWKETGQVLVSPAA